MLYFSNLNEDELVEFLEPWAGVLRHTSALLAVSEDRRYSSGVRHLAGRTLSSMLKDRHSPIDATALRLVQAAVRIEKDRPKGFFRRLRALVRRG
jgi:hypothetical protein